MTSNKSAPGTKPQTELQTRSVLPGFIVFEGLDGAGTTTQARLFVERLRAGGAAVVATAEPTDGPIGRRIRAVLSGAEQASDRTMAYLFAADRSEHLDDPNHGVLAELHRGRYVVCDRYLFSSLAYQGSLCGFEFVRMLNAPFSLPEHLVFLDLQSKAGLERIRARGRSEIYETPHIQDTVYHGYRQALEQFRDSTMQIHHIDGSAAPEAIAEEVWSRIAIAPIH